MLEIFKRTFKMSLDEQYADESTDLLESSH